MKNLLLLHLIFCNFFTQNAYSQDVNTAIANVRQYVKDIKLEKESVGQKLESDPNDPLEMTLTLINTNAKGQSTIDLYKFNFAFFDLSNIKRDASKKQLAMELKATEGLKAVGVAKNGKADKYTNELVFLCDNADDARDLEKALKDVVTVAKKAWEASLKIPNDYAGLWNYVQTNIKNFKAQGIDAQAKATQSTEFKDRMIVDFTKTEGKKTDEFIYDFSVGDLVESGLKVDISGNEVAFTATTADKTDFVTKTENKKSEYTNEARILMTNPSEAKKMQLAFQKLVPLARKELQNRLPKNTNGSFEGLKQITSFSLNQKQYNQSINSDCICQYSTAIAEKGKSSGQNYLFNFSDLTDFKLDMDKDLAKVTAKTIEKLEFVATTEKDKRKFDKEIEFTFADVEKARYFLAYMSSLSTKCKENLKPENFDWLVKKLENAGAAGYSQTLSLQEGGNRGKWKFAVTETGAKKSSETVYEFNVYDLDMAKLDFVAKDQNLVLKIPTKKKEKLIKQTIDGKPTFTAETQFLLTNAEDAKKINVTIKEIVVKYALLTDGKFVTNAIVFDVNSANIQASSNETLKTVGEILEDFKDFKIKIIGHTDSDGDDNKNLQLSQKRAQAVKDYLLKNYKVDASRLTFEGKGEKAPAMPNTTTEGKAANRRVEFVKI
jgi:outer membrane protein OmpA-like peptidoglycan-associated protein